MTNKKWHFGPPPSIGWWPASSCRDKHIVRWWDGRQWSAPAIRGMTERKAEFVAGDKRPRAVIEWHERPDSWPARSRT